MSREESNWRARIATCCAEGRVGSFFGVLRGLSSCWVLACRLGYEPLCGQRHLHWWARRVCSTPLDAVEFTAVTRGRFSSLPLLFP